MTDKAEKLNTERQKLIEELNDYSETEVFTAINEVLQVGGLSDEMSNIIQEWDNDGVKELLETLKKSRFNKCECCGEKGTPYYLCCNCAVDKELKDKY